MADLLKKKFVGKIDVINDDILKVDENNLFDQTLTVYGNLPYNISTEILCKWILNTQNQNWFDYFSQFSEFCAFSEFQTMFYDD